MYSNAMRGYDAWLTREPDYPEPPEPMHCTSCGGFLTIAPERTEPGQLVEQCTGISEDELGNPECTKGMFGAECDNWTVHEPHSFTAHAWVTEYRTCKKCGATCTYVDA